MGVTIRQKKYLVSLMYRHVGWQYPFLLFVLYKNEAMPTPPYCNERKLHCVKRLLGLSNQIGGKVELGKQRN